MVRITTQGSSFDTLLGVYTGNAVNALTLVAGNDDADDLTSAVSFTAAAGVTYQIAVDGYEAASGFIQLNVAPENSTAPLRLSPPQRLANGSARIWMHSADGRPLDLSRAAHVEVYYSANVTLPIAGWTRLNSSVGVQYGLLFIDDTAGPTSAMRFYRVIERP